MRLSVVRLIARREIRDLLRDRRTLFLILGMPLILYPFFALAGMVMAKAATEQTITVGIVGRDYLPETPALVNGDCFTDGLDSMVLDGVSVGVFRVLPLSGEPEAALREKRVDVTLTVPEDFARCFRERKPTRLTIDHRDGEDKSKLASRRLTTILRNYESTLRQERYQQAGLPKDFDAIFQLIDPVSSKPKLKRAADEIRDALVRTLPFILILWIVGGAIQPAVDLTAGEKERGTMETLLISPAERSELVYGKFIAVTAFTFGTVFWNLVWLTVGCVCAELWIGYTVVNKLGVLGCLVVSLPMCMLFSAIGLALGVFARSTKEGQYYLMPMFFIVMPLAFWSMMPTLELTTGTALLPITGSLLLQQKVLSVSADPFPWGMFVPVLGELAVSVVVALWLATIQFRREGVLFRELGSEKSETVAGK
jgi:sodium transport system permease protein